jgi:hypothetical protein
MLDNYIESLADDALVDMNLVFQWEVGPALRLERFDLVCPREASSRWRNADHWFSAAIPHPAHAITAEIDFTQRPSELEIPLVKRLASGDDERR